jgi:hypothetical protein
VWFAAPMDRSGGRLKLPLRKGQMYRELKVGPFEATFCAGLPLDSLYRVPSFRARPTTGWRRRPESVLKSSSVGEVARAKATEKD